MELSVAMIKISLYQMSLFFNFIILRVHQLQPFRPSQLRSREPIPEIRRSAGKLAPLRVTNILKILIAQQLIQ